MESESNKKKKAAKRKSKKDAKALLLGVGLDNKDGHVRVTRGPNFQLVGGSSETHEVMQETAIKLNEELNKRGKRLEDVGSNEVMDILDRLHH